MTAKSRYDYLRSDRDQFLDTAKEAARLTLPYLITDDDSYRNGKRHLHKPWQSAGAKGVVTLASKLMLALLPVQTSFFKLQIDEVKLMGMEGIDATVKSELDLSFSKIERTMMEAIAASDDRVIVHQAMKHLVVAGNALIYMGKDKLKLYPLNRYVVDRDGNGNVIEIVTKEVISRKVLNESLPANMQLPEPKPNRVGDDGEKGLGADDVDVYTHCRRDNNRYTWYQEVDGKMIPKSFGKAPLNTTPWLCLRFNVVDGEAYGRGRAEEFIGDLKSLEALSQAMVEGSAAAAKVVFTVSPSSTTKPQTLAAAGNGAIVQGRPEDIGVINVGKTADFSTVMQMIQSFEKRLGEAFLVLNVRDSERTTAEEVRMTQMELEKQLGGLFSLLTVDFLVPYLNRKLDQAQKTKVIPKIPMDLVNPTIVAGVNAIGRGQDQESLNQFIQTIAQSMGPESIQKYIAPEEFIKRLAASQGIDTLNLVKTADEVQQADQAAQQQAQDMAMTQQAGKFAEVDQKAQAAQAQQ